MREFIKNWKATPDTSFKPNRWEIEFKVQAQETFFFVYVDEDMNVTYKTYEPIKESMRYWIDLQEELAHLAKGIFKALDKYSEEHPGGKIFDNAERDTEMMLLFIKVHGGNANEYFFHDDLTTTLFPNSLLEPVYRDVEEITDFLNEIQNA